MDVEEGEAKICRLCGEHERIYIDVFGEEGVKRYLGLKIHRKINILIKEDDGMPQQICRFCLERLNFTCMFYDNCHDNQKKLWSAIEKETTDDNNAEDKENTISPRYDAKRRIINLSEDTGEKTHFIDAASPITDGLPKNRSDRNCLRRSCLREIYPNAQTATSLQKREQSVDIGKNKQDDISRKEIAGFDKTTIAKQEIDVKKKECSVSENTNSKTLLLSLLDNSKVHVRSLVWPLKIRSPCEADKPKNIANVAVNDSPLLGDEAESNRNSSCESDKLAVPINIGESSTIVANPPKIARILESNTIFLQDNENTALFELSIINERCKAKRKYNKISDLITDEQKEIIETYYSLDEEIIIKYAEKVRSSITVRDKKNIECNLCSAKYSRLDKCKVHVWTHLDIKPYKCKKCSYSTVTLSNVRCHIRKSHLKIKPFTCKLCSKEYATFALLKEHINIHIGLLPYNCETCDFSSTSRQALNNHMTIHMPSENIPCSICNKTFHSRVRMRAHMRIHNDNSLKCDICRVRLSNEKALEAHHKKVHIYDYICKICNKAHKSRKALHNHMNAHKEARYKCTKCSKTYKSKHILNEHLLKHEGIRKYKCSVCEKSFAQQSHLAAHNKVHNPPSYECPGCGRKHNRRDNMKIHMKRCKSLLCQ